MWLYRHNHPDNEDCINLYLALSHRKSDYCVVPRGAQRGSCGPGLVRTMEEGIHMRRFIAAALASTALAMPAMAADLAPYVKSPVVVPWTWTGVYFGGDVGGAWSDNTATWSPLPSSGAFPTGLAGPATGVSPVSGNTGGSAFAGGFFAGYNYQFSPSFVAGIEGDWTGMRDTGSFNQPWTFTGAGIIPGTSAAMNTEVEWAATLRGRLGYLIWPNLMLYGTGGGAWGKIQYGSAVFNSNNGYTAGSQFNNTSSGWVAGGGLEWAPFSGFGLLFRVEYLYYDFSSGQTAQATSPGPGLAAFPSGLTWTAPKMSVARFGMSYKF
jgi:outer membrane immunogenic protein